MRQVVEGMVTQALVTKLGVEALGVGDLGLLTGGDRLEPDAVGIGAVT